MVLNSGNLNRWIRVQRKNTIPDGAGGFIGQWDVFGAPMRAQRRDVSDGERHRSSGWQSHRVVRFTVRANSFTNEIAHTDRILHEGVFYSIDGIKEVPPGRSFIEITAISGKVE